MDMINNLWIKDKQKLNKYLTGSVHVSSIYVFLKLIFIKDELKQHGIIRIRIFNYIQ